MLIIYQQKFVYITIELISSFIFPGYVYPYGRWERISRSVFSVLCVWFSCGMRCCALNNTGMSVAIVFLSEI